MSRIPNLEVICASLTQISLLLVFFLVPLIFIPITSEVFEFNKLILVYALASIIFFSEIVRTLSQNTPTLKLPPFYLTGLIFLFALLLTTVTSIDQHVSLFGYYARFHGGLLSWIAYSVILLALIQQTPSFIISVIKISLLSGFLVSAWGFLEHWGIDASYWVQDVRYRVFSTLGQPNWLAAYLAMLMPFLFSFYLEAKSRRIIIGLFLTSLLFYTTFIFTYSRGGNIGLGAALLIWLILLGRKKILESKLRLVYLVIGLAVVTLIFSSGITSLIFGAAPHRTVENLQTGDQTAKTRLIVWQGSLDIFLHHPLAGTGPETFGETFYQYRPVAMNEISDFDFLFNKAHNEYINYLATTGLVGTITYTVLLVNFFYFAFKIFRKTRSTLSIATISSMAGYLIQNIFGFTVVPLAILFILNLAIIAIENPISIELRTSPTLRRFRILFVLPAIISILWIADIWRADVAYSKGISTGESTQAINNLALATELNPTEPLYYAELAYAYGRQASLLPDSPSAKQDGALAKKYADRAAAISPNERTIWRINAQTFEEITSLDPEYMSLALQALKKAITLAPSDPRVRLELGNFYQSQGNADLAIQAFKDSLNLKPDFIEVNIALAKAYLDRGDKDSANRYIEAIRKIDPKNSEIWALEQRESQ